MDYPQVIKYLYEQLPMFQRIGPVAFKKNLDNTLALCAALDNPHLKFKSIHIGGTNGKGSSSHMLAAVFQSAGYKTGLYTSPHLKEFTERIRVNGNEIPQKKVIDFVLKNKSLIESVKPSFFEMTVVMAFDHFAKEGVDVAIIEVGLGGRLDSTNVIQPICSLITNIGYDHQALLGNTLEEIAFEKAGIIKPETPIVVSEMQKEVKEVFERISRERNAPLFFGDSKYRVIKKELRNGKLVVDVFTDKGKLFEELQLGLSADYQIKNLPGVLKTIAIAKDNGFTIEIDAIRRGIMKTSELTGLKGRWQKLAEKPLVICDTGHNEDGIREVLKQIENTPYKKLFIVFGTVNDKDINKILNLLPKTASYFFCEASIPRALPATDLQKAAERVGLKGEVVKNVNDAIAEAKRKAQEEDLIFVGGSNFVVAEINDL
ncbi:MAG TPA: folylpolyglutamate synthase/dihydrofolate synthase family protein [Cytophagales bacterium]|nr:folylpolyglutamate synthase/dihydrofolate synthase family protein [Cytophagales bacterium]